MASTNAPAIAARPTAGDPAAPVPVLELDQVSLRFGGVKAMTDVSCKTYPRELFSIIGPNGAGKASTLNCISGRRCLWSRAASVPGNLDACEATRSYRPNTNGTFP